MLIRTVVVMGSCMLMSAAQASTRSLETPQTAGFAIEYQGLQSHYSDLPNPGSWLAENKFNERGLAVRWESQQRWFLEARASYGTHMRFLLEVEEDDEGEPQFEDDHGRSFAYGVAVGKRFWVNQYFSVLPSVGYVQRNIHTPQLYSDFNQERVDSIRRREHNAAIGIKAEYRVISRFAFSLNFNMLQSGERQQGIGIAYYFY